MITVVLQDDFLPRRRFRLAPGPTSADTSWVLHLSGRRLAGRVSATAVALVLAGGAVVLNGQASTGAAVRAAADSVSLADSPTSATITINNVSGGFEPNHVTIAKGGSLTIVNNDVNGFGGPITHNFSTDAIGPQGKPLIDTDLPPGPEPTAIPISTLGGGTYTFFCKFHGQMTGTLVIDGPPDGEVTTVPKFEQPLVQPPRLHGTHISIVMKKAKVRVLPHGRRTPMLTFGGTFPGPTIVRRTGQDTKVTFVNHLPRHAGAVTIHQHAGHQKSRFDGQPANHLIKHGKQLTYDYPLRDAGTPLPAALRFYHDHRMNRTAQNNWLGLQGMFLTTDPHDAKIGLPHGKYDIPLAITDRSFRSHNRLTNPFRKMTGMGGGPGTETVGQQVLVNGRYAPYQKVRPGRYRLQILNSSLFSSYDLALSNGLPLTQIGTGSGLLPHPVSRQDIVLGPAQRADVVVDFRKLTDSRVLLTSIHRTDGVPDGSGKALMQFRVKGDPPPAAKVPFSLARIQHYRVPQQVAMTWDFGLDEGAQGSHWTINGTRFDPKRVDHRIRLGTTERWVLHNSSPVTHFVHLHEELWRTLRRDGAAPPPWEQGYEDTWRLDPGETVVVAARFTDYTGKFMIHCHMLDHEDDGMMATFEVVKRR
jgi:FtsP/CotA-like multicopper oxidase with cupredoxin domain